MDTNIGSTISLQFDSSHDVLKGRLVGAEPPNFFIVRLPPACNGNAIHTGQSMSATYLHDGHTRKFKASVLHRVPKFQLIFMSYPEFEDAESQRKEDRVKCQIPATANIEKRPLKGLVADISNHGCQFIVNIPTTFKLCRVSVLTDIHLELSLLDPRSETKLRGKVRNTHIDECKIVLGIEFDNLEEALAKHIKSLINQLDILH
jgi:c-di-GMP-binding flagellar brake protein YcgR